MAWRGQNSKLPRDRVPAYYVNNPEYVGSYAKNQWGSRASRRIHDGFVLSRNYGLDTVSDDLNSSPYSSPYYINGRYNSDALTLQRGNSASVQGIKKLADIHSTVEDFTDADIQTTIEMWQGKQIRFSLPYDGKIVGSTVTLKNTEGCTGVLSIYFSNKIDGNPLAEASIDLCKVSQDAFEHFFIPLSPYLEKPTLGEKSIFEWRYGMRFLANVLSIHLIRGEK